MRILFICLGNICRSPLAQGILENKAQQLGLNWKVDSAGTGYWHAGEPPDDRTIRVARRHGLDISHLRARQFMNEDFDRFDLMLTADDEVHEEVLAHASSDAHRAKVHRMVTYLANGDYDEIPDPWYGGDAGFEEVYHLLDEVCDAIVMRHGPGVKVQGA